MPSADLIWTIVGFVLTLLILSHIIGDNPLFRIVTYLFVGVASGAVAVIAIYQVIWPKLILPILRGDYLTIIPLVLSLLLMAKLFPRYSAVGNFTMAYLVGAGAAVAVGGCNVEAADALSGIRSWDDTWQRVASGWQRCAMSIRAPGWRFDCDSQLWRGPAAGRG